MFAVNNILLKQNVEGYDFRYQAVINKAVSLGYTLPSQIVQIEQNKLVKAMAASGIWDQYDLFYNFYHDAPEPFSYINWSNPDVGSLTKFGTVTFTTKDGMKGNGTTGYFNVGVTPLQCPHYLQNSASFLISIKENAQNSTEFLWAAQESGRLSGFRPRSTSNQYNCVVNSQIGITAIGTSSDSSGFWYADRPDNTTVRTYKNGTLLDSISGLASDNLTGRNIILLARDTGTTISGFSAKTIRCFGLGGVINQSDMYTHWNSYVSSI